MSSAANINNACRIGKLLSVKQDGVWHIRGFDIIKWRQSVPEHTRFDMRSKLSAMRIRQLNEDTGDIQYSHVVDVIDSGEKEVFEVIAGDYRVSGSADHLVLTTTGYARIGDLKKNDQLIVRRFGKKGEDKLDPLRLKKIDGAWRSVWQRKMRESLQHEDILCRRCQTNNGIEIHHIVPVHKEPSLALVKENITLLCYDCHQQMHSKQGWQGGTYLYGATVEVQNIVRRGVERTYDLTIEGKYPNFLANGVVVHNSRNSASSRAIPVEKMIKMVEEDPYIPTHWGKNQKGMQAEQEFDPRQAELLEKKWRSFALRAIADARQFLEIGVHKQITNRLLEPFMWHTCIVSATEWSNWFNLRDNKMAHPEIQKIAHMMSELLEDANPIPLNDGQWHRPLVDLEIDCQFNGDSLKQFWPDQDPHSVTMSQMWDLMKKISAGRCARVSYLTHEGKRDRMADVELCNDLIKNGHMSPLEHVARPLTSMEYRHACQFTYHLRDGGTFYSYAGPREVRDMGIDFVDYLDTHFVGNFNGWMSYRKTIPNEHDILGERR